MKKILILKTCILFLMFSFGSCSSNEEVVLPDYIGTWKNISNNDVLIDIITLEENTYSSETIYMEGTENEAIVSQSYGDLVMTSKTMRRLLNRLLIDPGYHIDRTPSGVLREAHFETPNFDDFTVDYEINGDQLTILYSNPETYVRIK